MTEDREQRTENGWQKKSRVIRYWLLVIGFRGMRHFKWEIGMGKDYKA
jgi:hypothetical protein